MLLFSISAYLAFTLLLGFWASLKVNNSEDYILAGKNLPAFMVAVTIFSTWFGSEMIMGVPSLFVKEGIHALIIDAGGAFLCLMLVSIFFTKPIYNLNIYTVNDYFRIRYGRKMELVTSMIVVLSYFSWVASQFLALALIFNTLFGLSIGLGIVIGASIVLIYTYIGGMWSVSITDLMQAVIITIGLVIILFELLKEYGSFYSLFDDTPVNFLKLTPDDGLINWSHYIEKWAIFGVGSIVSQEIYQRALAARSLKSAKRGVFFGGVLMLVIGVVPSIIGFVIVQIHPEFMNINQGQNLIPEVVLGYMSLPIQIIFFGALISAILSTSSGAILAPATVLAENIWSSKKKSGKDSLLTKTRNAVIIVTALSAIYAYFNDNIHEMVVNSVTLITVGMTAPFVFGIYWSKTSTRGAWVSMIMGILSWGFAALLDSSFPPLLVGIITSFLIIIPASLLLRDAS